MSVTDATQLIIGRLIDLTGLIFPIIVKFLLFQIINYLVSTLSFHSNVKNYSASGANLC